MVSAADRARQPALVSRPRRPSEVPEWPTPDMITHDQLPGLHEDQPTTGGELNVPEL